MTNREALREALEVASNAQIAELLDEWQIATGHDSIEAAVCLGCRVRNGGQCPAPPPQDCPRPYTTEDWLGWDYDGTQWSLWR